MTKTLSLLVLSLVLLFSESTAQTSIADTSRAVFTVDFIGGYHSPGGDLADRFGSSGALGGGLRKKWANQWILGAQASYHFGTKVNEPVAAGIRTSQGFVIDNQGQYVDLLELQRGFTATAEFGRLFKAFGPNPNSGIVIMVGAGVLQHNIRLEARNNEAPSIEGEYSKGYDRLSNGFALHESIGYQLMSSNKLVNLYIGIEAYHAWTQSRRDFNFDLMRRDDTKRNDSMYGIRAIWSFPIYSRGTTTEYYR